MGTMLALPRTHETLDLLTARVLQIMKRYQLPFLLENVVNLLPDPPAEMTEAAFLNELAIKSGCSLLLDIYNLECNAHNQDYSVTDFLSEIDFNLVREIHVASGTERNGLMLDVHSQLTRNTTQKLLSGILAQAAQTEAVIFELMPEAVPVHGHNTWAEELRMLRSIVNT